MSKLFDRPFFNKTIRKFLSHPPPRRPCMTWFDGRLLYGVKSSHLLRHGRKYNRLVHLMQRLHKA